MKKIFALLTLIVVFSIITTNANAAKPEKAQGPHEKTTGEFTAYVGSVRLTMTIDAHKTDPVKGNVTYSNSSGKYFSGKVDVCYDQVDNKAVFAGTITEGNYPYTYFIVDVIDNGEGDKATEPDAVRVRTVNTFPTCSSISPSFPGIVGEGNIQVHKVVGDEDKTTILSSEETSTCTTITSGLLKNSLGETITTGFDEWGYNYQAHLFVGGYCDAYRNAAWCQPYKEIQVVMKWNDAWLSNKDCDGDGLLDRHYGYPSYIGSGAWETNHQWENYPGEEDMPHWNYFTKIVAAPSDAVLTSGVWYTPEGDEIGSAIWGEFATILEIYNDQDTGDHGVLYKSPLGPGFGQF